MNPNRKAILRGADRSVKGFLRRHFAQWRAILGIPSQGALHFLPGADFDRFQDRSGRCFSGDGSSWMFDHDGSCQADGPHDRPLVLKAPRPDTDLHITDERLHLVPPGAALTSVNRRI